MVFEHTNYRSYLKAALAERIAGNPAYSLRAFARDLKIHPSQLSAIFKGRKGLSQESALRTARALGLNASETEYFCLLIQYESAPSAEMKDVLATRLSSINRTSQVRELSVDVFKIISDWYHLPILQMTELKGFDFSPRQIAGRLGITPLETEAAIERLERLELLEKDEKGSYRKTHSDLLVKTRVSNRALQSFHKQMLQRAALSFDNQEASERYFASQVFPIDPAHLDQARSMIDRLADDLSSLFEKGNELTEVYQLGVQLFRLTSKRSMEKPSRETTPKEKSK